MNGFRLYWRYVRANFLANLQYKGWPFQILMVLAHVATDPVGVFLLFHRFGNVGEWTLERIMLIYAIAVTSFGLAETFSRGFDYFPWHIRTGEFDRILLRPRSTFVQIMGARFHIHRLARVFGGLFMITWSLARLEVNFTLLNLSQLVLALAGGYLVYTGVFIFSSAISFWTINALDWIYVFTNTSYQVAKTPMQYLPRWLKYSFTFLMPMLAFAYYPAAAVGGWGEAALGWIAFPAGMLFFVGSGLMWRVGVKYYASTGS